LNTQPELIWIDLRTDQNSASALVQLGQFFRVRGCSYGESISEELRVGLPDALFVDLDYPDRAGLRLIQQLKINHPSMPILMGTIQHSEELAVWAFRSGVLDFFVKPVPQEELRRCALRIEEIGRQKRRQSRRQAALGDAGMPEEAAPGRATESRALEPALQYISQNFRSKIMRDEAAALCAMNPFRFSRHFKDTYGVSFREYVVRHRIKEACRLLERPGTSITNVAFAVGFNDVGYFSRMFKQQTGVTPTAMKHQLREKSRPVAAVQRQRYPLIQSNEDSQARLALLPPLPMRH
jgi:AraC-like DNA-binding protein